MSKCGAKCLQVKLSVCKLSANRDSLPAALKLTDEVSKTYEKHNAALE